MMDSVVDSILPGRNFIFAETFDVNLISSRILFSAREILRNVDQLTPQVQKRHTSKKTTH